MKIAKIKKKGWLILNQKRAKALKQKAKSYQLV